MKKLYLLRHGQTVFNTRHLIQGRCDSPLTDLGIRQAEAVRDHLEGLGVRFDHACCSSAERACDTCEIVTRGTLPYERRKDLREFSFGKLEAGSTSLILPGNGPYGDFLVPFGGESENEVAMRMGAGLAEIMGRPGNSCVLAVSHGAAIFAFLTRWYAQSTDRVDRILGNCTLYELDFSPEGGSFCCVGHFTPEV